MILHYVQLYLRLAQVIFLACAKSDIAKLRLVFRLQTSDKTAILR